MIESKTNQERIEKLPFIFRQRIENLLKTINWTQLEYEILFCEQAVIIISYVKNKLRDEILRSSLPTFDEYKKSFPLRREMIIWEFSCRSPEEQKRLIPEMSTETYAFSLMMARLYFSNHEEDIGTLPVGTWLF